MFTREKEIVNEQFLGRSDVYNLRCGGNGGFDYINKNQMNGFSDRAVAQKGRKAVDKILEERYGANWRTEFAKLGGKLGGKAMFDKKLGIHSSEYKDAGWQAALQPAAAAKKKETLSRIMHQQGSKNSQHGTMWITNGTDSKKIKKTDPIPVGWQQGRKIKA